MPHFAVRVLGVLFSTSIFGWASAASWFDQSCVDSAAVNQVVIPVPFGVRIWIATGHTDMRKGMRSLALQIQLSTGTEDSAKVGI